MSTCTLRLYSGTNWELLPEKLLIVDNIEDYLATKTATQLNNFQYVKNQLELSIVINASQLLSQPKNASYKYVRVYDDDSGYIYYYYVKKAIWTAQSSVRLELVMDVLNTFQEGTHYTFKANTRIIREHKDRFIKRRYLVKFEIISADIVGSLPNIGESIYLSTIADTSIAQYTGILKLNSYPYLSIAFDNIDLDELQAWLDEIQSMPGRICFCKDAGNFLAAGLGETVFIDETSYDIYRNIDEIPENINPLLQCGNASGVKIENNKTLLQKDWYLLYRNQNTPSESLVNPVECYLIPSEEIKTDAGFIENGRLIPSFIEEGKYYYFAVSSGQATLSNGVNLTYPAAGRKVLMVTKAGGLLSVTFFYVGTAYGDDEVMHSNYDGIEYITFTGLPVKYRIENNFLSTGSYDYYALEDNMPYNFNNSGTENTIDDITKLDRTDSKNIKLIKLPYCPYDFTISSSRIEVSGDANWDYVSLTQSGGGIINCLKLKDLNLNLRCTLTESIYSKNPIMNLKMSMASPSNNEARRGASFESKLYASEFYQGTYVYDSFAFKIQLEKCDVDTYLDSRNLVIYFDMTRTINSKFLFTFSTYNLRSAESNYPKSLPIARNNEEVLYNVPYINYIRTGYNYDVKQKNISNASNLLGVGLSFASIGASLLMPTAPLKAAGVIGALVSMAVSIKGAVVSAIQGEENLKQKILQSQSQTASVSGSDDVDLMSVYAENRLKYLVYEPREVTKNLLYDLFYYAGYNSGRMGIPNHNTRINFDYLEADVSIQKTSAIPQDCLAELINAFKTGVTYMHKTDRASNKWDFAQTLENWEKIFF